MGGDDPSPVRLNSRRLPGEDVAQRGVAGPGCASCRDERLFAVSLAFLPGRITQAKMIEQAEFFLTGSGDGAVVNPGRSAGTGAAAYQDGDAQGLLDRGEDPGRYRRLMPFRGDVDDPYLIGDAPHVGAHPREGGSCQV
jgi:hypothetical protein